MKITKLSLAAIAAVAMTTGAMAEVDLKTGGQAVVYYQTNDGANDVDLFERAGSSANTGIQLNVDGDLGNDFGLGLQGTGLSTWGLENQVVSNVMQSGLGNDGDTANAGDYFAITKAYLTKKIGNTTIKGGRQALPKALSPLAFSENWNVFQNTFDAIVAINSDIQDTTVVGAYVSRSNQHGNLNAFGDMSSGVAGAVAPLGEGAYMLTVANKSIPEAPITLSYYDLESIGQGVAGLGESGNAIWGDVQVDAGLPVKFGLQGGQITPENGLNETKVVGAKVTGNAGPVAVKLAYSKVGAGAVSVQNVGTGVKTPLYTQMILNQNHIATDADTVVLQAAMPAGPGKLIAQYDLTTDNSAAGTDYNELDVIYKFDALGMKMLAAYVYADHDVANTDPVNIVRLWGRYNF